jgi:hypothetical protein
MLLGALAEDQPLAGNRNLQRRTFLALAAAGGPLVASSVYAQRAQGGQVPKRSLTLDVVAQFGAKGDGKSDDTAAFRRMHATALTAQVATPDLLINFRLPAGRTFLYTWNRWTWGLRHLRVDAYGARVQCTSNSDWDVDKRALVTNRGFFQAYGYEDPPTDPELGQLGSPIRTASVGDTAVTLWNPAEAIRFASDMWVLVFSYSQQQYGLPPNARFYERAKIVRIVDSAIDLDRPLRFEHRDDNPEVPGYPYSPAKARILAIDREDVPLGLSHRYEGLTTLPSPHARGGGGAWDQVVHSWVQATGVLDTEFVGCDLCGLSAGEGATCVVRNSKVEYNEPDKLIELVRYESCNLTELTSCAGVQRAVFVDTRFEWPATCWANSSLFERCRFYGAGEGEGSCGLTFSGPQSVSSARIRNSAFFGRDIPNTSALGGLEPLPRVVVGKDATLQDGVLRVALSGADDSIGTAMVNGLRVGSIMTIGGTDGGYGRVTKIWGGDAYAFFRVTFSRPVANGRTLYLRRLNELVVTDSTLEDVPRGYVAAARFSWNGEEVSPPAVSSSLD